MYRYCPKCAQPLTSKKLDGLARTVCANPSCNFVLWENPVPVVAGLILYKESLLLARNARWPTGIFSFITGYLEKNESPEQAIVRETKEELGLTAEITGFVGHYPFSVKNQLLIVYELQAHGELKLGDELAESRLLPYAAIDQYDFGPLSLSAQIVADWNRQR